MNKSKAVQIIKYVALTLLTLIMFIPLYTVFIMGTYYSEDIFHGLPILPSNYLIENLKTVVSSNFFLSYLNSFIVSVSAVILSAFACTTIAFALAKYQFKLQKAMLAFLMVIMMVPTQISIIGYVLEMRTMGLNNTLFPLIAVWIANPFGAFFMTQFMRDAIPNDVLESGRLDGCTEPGLLFHIIMPFIRPGVMTLVILVFLWSWNNYMLPLIIINKEDLYTIPLMINNLSNAFRTDYGAEMCALSLCIMPIILIFILCSKSFIKGIAAGAVKG